jgi:hypothetical protein
MKRRGFLGALGGLAAASAAKIVPEQKVSEPKKTEPKPPLKGLKPLTAQGLSGDMVAMGYEEALSIDIKETYNNQAY